MNDNHFDELLDGILNEDAKVEPITGLEGRILTRLAITAERRFRWRFVAWGLGAAIPACLALLIILTHHGPPMADPLVVARHHAEPRPPLPIETPKPTLTLVRRETKPTPIVGVISAPEQADALPKLDVFPTPSVPEEPVRELAVLASDKQTPLSSADQPGKPPPKLIVEPITIATIEISPIFPPPRDLDKPKDSKENK